MMFRSDWHCPSLVVQNPIFHLWLHRQNERRFPLFSVIPSQLSRPKFVRGWFVVISFCLLLLLLGIF